MLNFDPNNNVNTFWKMCMNAQEMNQLAFKAFLNAQKIHSSQNLLEQFVKECMACVGDNTGVAIQLFQALSSVKKPEDLVQLQERVFTEYSEKNIEHAKKLLSMYNDLLQESYHSAKQNAEDLTGQFTNNSHELAKKFAENIGPASAFVNNYAANNYTTKQNHKKPMGTEKDKESK